eukprot:gene24519-10509_t
MSVWLQLISARILDDILRRFPNNTYDPDRITKMGTSPWIGSIATFVKAAALTENLNPS